MLCAISAAVIAKDRRAAVAVAVSRLCVAVLLMFSRVLQCPRRGLPLPKVYLSFSFVNYYCIAKSKEYGCNLSINLCVGKKFQHCLPILGEKKVLVY